ncbi:NADPH-dependent FMN reductase [Hyalangium minutum]|uniref:NADPH:quinone oxidoreductase n=1 Tax=Hyalangium minutum TaxID=394096 RepID=A0A085WMW2_9BACT|nr:NADPH-dependent FMN reductase [Hyalangium minutum]KFE69025.1 NADPH:quinone oxidoreductase [Hyalangium minutum]
MSAPRIIAISGSLRTGSFNRKLLALLVEQARAKGAEVDVVDLKVLVLPIYDGDIEAQGLPPPAVELRERISKAQGLLISSPEYNASIPGSLKNAIDWASRGGPNVFKGKWAALAGASPGMFGTVRMQAHLRQSLTHLGMNLLPDQFLVSHADQAFTEEGRLKDESRLKSLEGLVTGLIARIQG